MTKLFLKYLIDFFFPPFCTACNKRLITNENFICQNCLSKFELASLEFIQHCYEKNIKETKLIQNIYPHYLFAKNTDIQNVFHQLKYNQKYNLGIILGNIVGEGLAKNIDVDIIDYIIPVPIFITRRSKRGYNQSDFISKGVASILKKKVLYRSLLRIRDTESQTKLSIEQRKNNVNGAFKIINSKKIKNKNILLIDDIITTGATIIACARVLKEGGANSIFAASAAIAQDHIFSGAEIPNILNPFRST